MTASPWIRCPHPQPQAEVRLLCVPHAGGGPSFFARWASELPSSVEVCLAHLPGRESRLHELPIDDIGEMADRLAAAASSMPELPLALFGHSMGAVVAFEVAHRLDAKHLLVSASAPPFHTDIGEPLAHLPDDEFLAAVSTFYGRIPDLLMNDPVARRHLLPALRSDFLAFERYRWQERAPLRCPISILAGSADRTVAVETLDGWCGLTVGECKLRVFDGGHFFLGEASTAVQRFICERLRINPRPEARPVRSTRATADGGGSSRRRSLAFLLTGVGDHYAGMGRNLYESEAVFRAAVDRCSSLLAAEGVCLLDALYPAPTTSRPRRRDGTDLLVARPLGQDELEPAQLGNPAVFTVGYALSELLTSWGVRPQAMIGYSLGEYLAACLAGVLSIEDGLRLVTWRAQRLDELPPGAMLAVSLSEEEVRDWLGGDLDLAAVNSPVQCVVAGPPEAIADLQARLARAGVAHRRVRTGQAGHSRMMQSLASELASWIDRHVHLSPPRIPYISNVTGSWITAEEATDPTYWGRHLCQTVQLAQGLDLVWADPGRVMLELGPGRTLCTCARHHRACGRERLALVQPTLPATHEPESDHEVLLRSLGRLRDAGLYVDPAAFHDASAEELGRHEQ